MFDSAIPDEMLRNLLVCILPSGSIVSVKLKEPCEHGRFLVTTFLKNFGTFVRIKKNHMLTRQMNLQAEDGWMLMMDRKLKETSRCLRCGNVSTVPEFRNFISPLDF